MLLSFDILSAGRHCLCICSVSSSSVSKSHTPCLGWTFIIVIISGPLCGGIDDASLSGMVRYACVCVFGNFPFTSHLVFQLHASFVSRTSSIDLHRTISCCLHCTHSLGKNCHICRIICGTNWWKLALVYYIYVNWLSYIVCLDSTCSSCATNTQYSICGAIQRASVNRETHSHIRHKPNPIESKSSIFSVSLSLLLHFFRFHSLFSLSRTFFAFLCLCVRTRVASFVLYPHSSHSYARISRWISPPTASAVDHFI